MSFQSTFAEVFTANSLGELATPELASRFEALTSRMLEVNSRFNLTAIKDELGIILKHYADSLTISKLLPDGASLIDVGCGAGFPSLPLAIARPDLRIVALDSTAKRIGYINETARLFVLDGIAAVTARAEELSHDSEHRERYDFACARAVARLNVLAEYCLPYVRLGGEFIAMKANVDEELTEAQSALEKLGGELVECIKFELTSPDGERLPRALVRVRKVSPTPALYPRSNSQIAKKPL